MLRPVLPALRAGLADLLTAQLDGPGELEVVVATGDDLTRTLTDGSHPSAVPTDPAAARDALPGRLRPLAGPDLPAAAARLLDAVGDDLATREESDRPERVVVLLVGEGGVGDAGTLRQRIEHQRDTYAWEFALVDVSSGPVPSPAWGPIGGVTARPNRTRKAADGTDAEAGLPGGGTVVVEHAPAAERDRPDPATRFGVPATATITAGPGAAGVGAALTAATGFVLRARGSAPWQPVPGFTDDERAAADVPDTRPAWRRLLRMP